LIAARHSGHTTLPKHDSAHRHRQAVCVCSKQCSSHFAHTTLSSAAMLLIMWGAQLGCCVTNSRQRHTRSRRSKSRPGSLLIPDLAIQHFLFGLFSCQAKQDIIDVVTFRQPTCLYRNTPIICVEVTYRLTFCIPSSRAGNHCTCMVSKCFCIAEFGE